MVVYNLIWCFGTHKNTKPGRHACMKQTLFIFYCSNKKQIRLLTSFFFLLLCFCTNYNLGKEMCRRNVISVCLIDLLYILKLSAQYSAVQAQQQQTAPLSLLFTVRCQTDVINHKHKRHAARWNWFKDWYRSALTCISVSFKLGR